MKNSQPKKNPNKVRPRDLAVLQDAKDGRRNRAKTIPDRRKERSRNACRKGNF